MPGPSSHASGRRGTSPVRPGAGAPLPAVGSALLAVAALLLAPSAARAQLSDEAARVVRMEATPLGALPPQALPMPASRDNNYWVTRLVVGQLGGRGPGGRAIAGGIGLQWRGGSVFELTGGYQKQTCAPADSGCGGHALFGARARMNFITAGPTVAALIGDYTANSTLGTELGFGYAPGVLPGVNACTVDLGAPVSVAMFQAVRVSAFVKPGLLADIRCSGGGPSSGLALFTGLGVAVHQIGDRGLDLHFGLQRIFRRGTGYVLGLTLSYTRLP